MNELLKYKPQGNNALIIESALSSPVKIHKICSFSVISKNNIL